MAILTHPTPGKTLRHFNNNYIKNREKPNTSRSKVSDRVSDRNNNKFSLNLSAVRKVSAQKKNTSQVPQKRDRSTRASGTITERWRNGRKGLNSTIGGNRTERQVYKKGANQDREDAYSSIISHYKKINELNSSMGLRSSVSRSRKKQ